LATSPNNSETAASPSSSPAKSKAPTAFLGHLKSTFGGPVIANDTMDADDGRRFIDNGSADAIAFGRDYIATPDLAERPSRGLALNEQDSSTFYGTPGADPAIGYVDYPALVH